MFRGVHGLALTGFLFHSLLVKAIFKRLHLRSRFLKQKGQQLVSCFQSSFFLSPLFLGKENMIAGFLFVCLFLSRFCQFACGKKVVLKFAGEAVLMSGSVFILHGK